jgi:cytochrome P450
MAVSSMVSPQLPGPRSVPLLGVYGSVLPFFRDPIAYMRGLHACYGDIAALGQDRGRYVFVFAPQYNRQILSDPALFHTADAGAQPLRIPEGTALARMFTGLLQTNGEKHTQQRRLMMPAFHRKRIEAYRDDMVALTEQQIAGWAARRPIRLLDEMKSLTIAVAVKTLLGLDPATEGMCVRQGVEEWMRLLFAFPTIAAPFNIPGLPYRRLLRLAEELEQEVQGMIRRKRAAGLDPGDVLSMLMRAHDEDGTRLNDTELVAQTGTLFVAGHITTASALTWTLFLLTMHPRVLADLLDELDSTLHGAAPTVEQLASLPLLEAVVKESMRLFPPFFWSLRISTAPFQLGPYALPKGTNVAFSAAVTHRRPDLYAEPERFLPERWQTLDRSPYEYLPFAGGPRMCIGAGFAMLEMRLALAMIVQRYRLVLPRAARVDHAGLAFSYPKDGMPVLPVPQDRRFRQPVVRGNVRALVTLD